MTSIRRIKIDNNTYELRDARGSQLYVGTCSTAAATNPKVCTVEEFPVDENGKPYVGTEIVVKFDATNTSTSTSPKLNVNGTGEISIWYNNAVLASAKSAYAGYANRYLHYVYDGTYWVFMGHSVDNNSTYSNVALGQGYAVQNNSAASATITAALGSYALTANGIVSVKFIYDVPANATLNINGKGAKAIYNKDAAITSGVIKAGDTATFIYNTYYRLISVDRWQDKQDAISDLAAIRSGASKGATAIQQADLAAVATSGSYNDLADKPTIPTAITVDSTITQNGTNPVQGSAIYSALGGKQDRQVEIINLYYNGNEPTWTNSSGDSMTIVQVNTLLRNSSKNVIIKATFDDIGRADGTRLYYRTSPIDDDYVMFYALEHERVYWIGIDADLSDYSYMYLEDIDAVDLSYYVKTSFKINNKPLSGFNMTLTASDVGADVFVVNIESDGSNVYTCDKTNAEIYAAWQAGRNIVLITNDEQLYKLNSANLVVMHMMILVVIVITLYLHVMDNKRLLKDICIFKNIFNQALTSRPSTIDRCWVVVTQKLKVEEMLLLRMLQILVTLLSPQNLTYFISLAP